MNNEQVNPLLLSLAELKRTPGSMLEIETEIPAPSDLSVAMARVIEGSPMEIRLRLESVMEGVLVTAELEYPVTAECARCLDPIEWVDSCRLMELYRYSPEKGDNHQSRALEEDTDEDESNLHVENDSINLEGVFRDSIVLDLPLRPLCTEECAGLCAVCGEKVENGEHDHVTVDPRWSALSDLASKNAESTIDTPEGV